MKYFTKIDQTFILKSSNAAKIYIKDNKVPKKDKLNENKIIEEINNFLNLYKSKKFFNETWGGTWEWIDKKKRNYFYPDVKNDHNVHLNHFSNFFRNWLSFGLISSHWNKKREKGWKQKLFSDIFKNLICWEEFTKKTNKDYALLDTNLNVGNPYGLEFKKNLILFDTPRHDYYANKIINLIKTKKKIPIIIEIGGGYGGLVSQLLKRNIKFKYINIDLLKTLPVAYYFIKRTFGTKIKISDFVDEKILKKNNFIFIPYFGQNFWRTKLNADVLFNSNSFSEMGKKTLTQYFKEINNKIKPKYLMHQNTNLTSFDKLKKYQEIPSSKFPIDQKNYELINFSISLFQGGSGRYREHLYKRKN